MRKRKPVLVTGSHRSGTTWVGRMISKSSRIAYVHEPFNVKHDLGICNIQFNNWYTYICDNNEKHYYNALKDTLELKYRIVGIGKDPTDTLYQMKNYLKFLWYRSLKKTPLIKDPIAFFSAEWLSSRFDMNTIVMIRHPAAFAASLKVKSWYHPFSHFLKQPMLMEKYLKPFQEEIRKFENKKKDIIDQAALLWNIIHCTILKYKEEHPDWMFIRHEDLSRKPIDGFCEIYKRLNIEFTDKVKKEIAGHSFLVNTENNKNTSMHGIKRDSFNNIYSWKDRLSVSEIERLKSLVKNVAREFYSNGEW